MTKIMAVQSHAVAQLPKSTIRLLASSQVITSVSSVVKELMENALDAGAASIDIRLEKHGLEKIEVKDDGCGIREADCTCMALPHYTSKLKSFTDLEELVSYGFRGEALHSVCSVASVSITTRTNDDTTARRYKLDKCGQAVEFETVHGLKGTTVTVTDLFKNLPVRRQVMSCTKRMNEELRKVENIVKSLSVINPAVRVSLAHNKCLIWQKTAVQHLRLSVMQVFSYNITKHLHHIIHHTNKVDIEMLIPKHDCDIKSLCSGAGTESYHLFVSKRPIKDKEIEKVISEVLSGFFGNDLPPNKSILCIIAITLPPDRLDINLEPNKTKIFIKDKEEILNCLTDLLNSYYSRADSAINTENKIVDEPKAKKKRMESTRENSEIEETTLVDSTSEILDKSSVLDKELPFSSSITKPNNFTPLQPINQETNFVQQNNISVENKNVHSNIYPVEAVNKNLKQRINIESILLQESELELVPRGCSPSLPNELVESVIGSPNSRSTHSDLGGLEATEPEPNNSVVDDSMLKNSRTLDSKLVGHIFYPQKIDDSITKLENDRVNEIQRGKSENFSRSALTDNCLDKEKAPTVQLPVESVEHNYLDNPSLSQWSKGGLISSSGDKILGSCVLKKSTVESEEKYRLESSNFLGVNPNSQMKTIENSIPDERNVLENGANPGQESIPLGNKLFSCESRRKPSDNDGVIAETVYKQSKTEFASSSFSDDKSLELERSVSSQMGNKQMSGFTTFARQMRSQILKESPGISFTAVAGILASKWRSLQESEKDRYNIIASSNKNKKNLKTVDKDVKKENLKSPSCESPNNERNYIVSNATMESLSISLDIPVENSNSSVVGRLGSSDLWICTRVCGKPTTEIGLINSQLLDEAYRFKQNMNIMELPLEPLERSITISPRFLSEKLWKVLVSLESVIDRSGEGSVITDKRIVMNGFRIRIVSNGENTCAHLMDLALHITDHYGVDDLQMTLELIEKHGVESCTVTQSRCPNAIKYIQSETFRQTAQMLNHDILNDAHELENRLRIIESDKSTCWKSFYKALHVSP